MGKSKRIRRWIAAAAGVCLTAVSAAADSLDLGGFQVEVEGEQEKPPVTAKPAEPPVPTQPPQPVQEPVHEPVQEPVQELAPEPIPEPVQEETPAQALENDFDEPTAATGEFQDADRTRENFPDTAVTEKPVLTPTLDTQNVEKKEGKETKAGVKFLRQLKIKDGQMAPQISLEGQGDWYVYSFQVNQREVYFHWEGSWCTGEKVQWKRGRNEIRVLARTKTGDFLYMEPWIVLRQTHE